MSGLWICGTGLLACLSERSSETLTLSICGRMVRLSQGRLYEELGDAPRAANFYQRALECACGPAERRFLERCYCRVGQALSPAN
jgi:predicted RNA polymerase sigma factor